jgi:hypothetical protein
MPKIKVVLPLKTPVYGIHIEDFIQPLQGWQLEE